MRHKSTILMLAAALVCVFVNQPAAGQATSWTEVAQNPGMTPAGPGPVKPVTPPAAATAALVTYASRAVFDVANPGLPVEDFEDGDAAPGGFLVCDAPLGAGGSAACGFAPGDILPGIAFQDNPGPEAGALILLGAGTSLNPSQALITNTFADSFDILFNPPVSAAGMDLHSTPSPGQGPPDLVGIQLYDAGGALIASFADVDASGPGNFWGVVSGTPVGRISILSQSNQAEGVDNLAFGTALAPSGIPTLGWAGLLALTVAMSAAALWAIRLRSA